MEDDSQSAPASGSVRKRSLVGRIPGQSVAEVVLRSCASAPPQRAMARFFGANPLPPDSRSWFSGALGEIEAGRMLARLGPEWLVLHAVPVGAGSSDIDHVVVGPGGVFTINTKRHAGQNVWAGGNAFLVAGIRQNHIRNSLFERQRARKMLSAAVRGTVPVTAVIVVVGASSLTVKDLPAGVAVLEVDRLTGWITRRPQLLDTHQLGMLREVAVRPEVWRTGPAGSAPDGPAARPATPADPAVVGSEFEALCLRARRAGRRRTAWAFAAIGVVAATMLAVASSTFLRLLGAG